MSEVTNDLIEEMEETLARIDRIIDVVYEVAAEKGREPLKEQYSDGKYILPPLLLAKSNILPALLRQVELEEASEKAEAFLAQAKQSFLDGWNKGTNDTKIIPGAE